MSTLMDELTAIKTVEDKITANKVANFAYTDTAYNDPATYADGVASYNPDAEQNIPVGNPSTLKVNATILTKGWRAQASAITRMLMNHFLGRCSYNLNKVNDLFSLLLTKLMAFMGQPDGLATLDQNGHLVEQSPVGSPYVSITRAFLGAVFGRLLGRTWTRITGDTAGRTFNCVAYANGLWVAVGTEIYWSEDSKNWNQATSSGHTFYVVTYNEGIWIAISNYGIWRSEDGKNWNQTKSGDYTRVAYANGLWVAGSNSQGLWWSEDSGINWTQVSGATSSYTFSCITYANGLWVAGSYGYGLWWSEDGKNWTQGTGGTSGTYSVIAYGEGIWLAGSFSQGLWRSGDGKNWAQSTVITSYTINSITYANGTWIVGSDGHGLWYAHHAVNWTQVSGATSSYTFRCITYANGVWLAGSNGHGLWRSEDGIAWVYVLSNTYTYKAVTYAKGIWVAGSDEHGLWYSSVEDLIADGTIDLGADIPLVNA